MYQPCHCDVELFIDAPPKNYVCGRKSRRVSLTQSHGILPRAHLLESWDKNGLIMAMDE